MCCASTQSLSEESGSYLLIQTAFLGDVILATALAENLHQRFPGASIDILVRKGNESVFENHPFIRTVFIWDKKNNKYKNLFHLLKQIRNRQYDHVINLQRYAASGFLTAFSKARNTYGFNKNPFSLFFKHKSSHKIAPGIHETDRNLTLLSSILPPGLSKPRLYPSPQNFLSVNKWKTATYITLSPASVWYTKSFPNYKWIELVEFLNEHGDFQIYLLGAPNEFEYCQFIIDKGNAKNIHNLAGSLTILESAALMKDAAMNYVNDSAPLHIASSMNAPVTAFYCSTIPEFGFGPLSDTSKVIQTSHPLDCKPCGLHGYKECPLIHFKCGRTIEITKGLLP